MTSWHLSPVGSYGLVVAISVVFLALLGWLGPALRRMAPKRRAVLVGLRLAVFLAIVAALLRPTYVYTEMKRHRATLIVLVDRSRSMAISDAADGKTRWQVLQQAVKESL